MRPACSKLEPGTSIRVNALRQGEKHSEGASQGGDRQLPVRLIMIFVRLHVCGTKNDFWPQYFRARQVAFREQRFLQM